MDLFNIPRLSSEEILHGVERSKYFSMAEHLESSCPAQGGIISCYVMLDKILTTDDLRKRGLIIMDWYIMCKSHGENVAHIFLQIRSYGRWFSVYLVFLE